MAADGDAEGGAEGGEEGGARLAVSALNKQITRKTMLPSILHYLNAHAASKS